MPAAKPGRGGAARYVSGRMPANAKNSHRREGHSISQPTSTKTIQPAAMRAGETEDERIQAMFKIGADQWAQDQEQMAK
jgi:protein MPE1